MATKTDDLFAGRYELGDVVGSGGSGMVRSAQDTVLDRPVAIKLLRAGSGDPTVRTRLRLEAQLAGSLVHPGIARVYDYGEDDSAEVVAPYIVMQYVEGTSLWHLLQERRCLSVAEVMDLLAQVGSALQVAHEAGIVHRDLKPSNILVTPEGRYVLVDFGIARTLDTDPLTVTGAIIGTVDYISPEQGSGRMATAASDLYSLGMVAYECLTGRKPFHRESPVATALAHLQDEAPELGADVAEPVRALVTQLIAKDPEDRPGSAGEVANRAAALYVDPHRPSAARAAGAHVRPPPPTPAARAAVRTPIWRREALRSRRVQVAAAAVAVVLAVTAFVGGRSSSTVQPRMPDVEGMTFAEARGELEELGIEVERRPVDVEKADRGTVLEQLPGAGTAVGDSGAVLEVASGKVVLDPAAVVGKGYSQAARALVRLGLVPVRAEAERPGGDGTVITALPAGRLKVGSIVTLTVGVEPSAPTAGMAPAG